MRSKRAIIDLGKPKWRGIWVTKSDVVELLRCRYRVYLSHATGIPIPEMKDLAALSALLQAGIEHEEGMARQKGFAQTSSPDRALELFKKDIVLRTPIVYRNHELGIHGIPDFISTAKGRLYPVEAKLHKEVRGSDEIELAFYWMLLNPLRRDTRRAKGYVLLGTGEMEGVNLSADTLFEVESLIDEVRQVKTSGAAPVLSGECKQCLIVEDCKRELSQTGGLSLVNGIAYVRNGQLKEMGIETISALATTDCYSLSEQWNRRFTPSPGLHEIRGFQLHALSLIQRKPVFFGDQDSFSEFDDPLMILDLEYDPESYIWLVGARIQTKKTTKYHQLFAERFNSREERRILMGLIEILASNPKHRVVTYSPSADIPNLRNAWKRQGFPSAEWQALVDRNLDLHSYVKANYRFPMKEFGIKELGEYLGFRRLIDIPNGLAALGEYRQYITLKDQQAKSKKKQRLLDYNKEDLDETAFALSKLSRLDPSYIVESF